MAFLQIDFKMSFVSFALRHTITPSAQSEQQRERRSVDSNTEIIYISDAFVSASPVTSVR